MAAWTVATVRSDEELEGPAVAFGAAAHAGQAAGSGWRADAVAVVGYVESDQLVLLYQGDADGGGVGVAGAVRSRSPVPHRPL